MTIEQHIEFLSELFVSLTPKLGGGGITDAQMYVLRAFARDNLSKESRAIVGMTSFVRDTKYGHRRTASCGCGWNPDIHGNICPEHGLPALTE